MNRRTTSWLGSFAVHAAGLAWLGLAAALVPVQIGFQKGRTAVELQASIAGGPQDEPEPPTKLKPEPKVDETPPPTPPETDVERQPATPPNTKTPVDDAPPEVDVLNSAVAALNRSLEPPLEPRTEVERKPRERIATQAEPRVIEATAPGVEQAASQADSGVDYDTPAQPHPLNRYPSYPPDAYARRQQGTVVLHLLVTPVGTVGDVRIVRSSGVTSLDAAAVTAARAWRYTPALKSGAKVAMTFETHVNFAFRG